MNEYESIGHCFLLFIFQLLWLRPLLSILSTQQKVSINHSIYLSINLLN